jgi:transposase
MPRNRRRKAKLAELKAGRTLNPNLQSVVDALFQENEFFDSADVVQVKYEMLRRVVVDGWTISRASESFGFSRPSFYEAQTAFEQKGIAGLIPDRRGPRNAHKLSDEVIAFIEQCRTKDTALSQSDLVDLIEDRFGFRVHRRSIERALARKEKKHKSRR